MLKLLDGQVLGPLWVSPCALSQRELSSIHQDVGVLTLDLAQVVAKMSPSFTFVVALGWNRLNAQLAWGPA